MLSSHHRGKQACSLRGTTRGTASLTSRAAFYSKRIVAGVTTIMLILVASSSCMLSIQYKLDYPVLQPDVQPEVQPEVQGTHVVASHPHLHQAAQMQPHSRYVLLVEPVHCTADGRTRCVPLCCPPHTLRQMHCTTHAWCKEDAGKYERGGEAPWRPALPAAGLADPMGAYRSLHGGCMHTLGPGQRRWQRRGGRP